jgi:hypothetical protein
MVRTFVTTLLTGLILACPLLCGAAEACHVAHGEHGASPEKSPAPAHCPEDSDDCICRGALQSADLRVPGIDALGLSLPLQGLVGILAHSPAHSVSHLTSGGAPTGLASWGDSITVRALLQNFRC